MAGYQACLFLVIFGTLSASPIKFLAEGDEKEISSHLFRELGKVIAKFGAHPDNETKTEDLDIESADSFKFGPEHMRKMIASKMMGSENPPLKKERKSLKEKEDKGLKLIEQIGCSEASECNSTSYCNKLSYTCVKCHNAHRPCHHDIQCCSGFTCDKHARTCRKKTKGQKCSSSSDCGGEQCCALNDNGEGECTQHLQEGDECGSDPFTSFFTSQSSSSSSLFSKQGDLPDRCPCAKHLVCQKKSSFLFVDPPTCAKMKSVHTSEVMTTTASTTTTTSSSTTARPHNKHDHDNHKPPKHKSFIKITLRSSPILRFRSMNDESDPLSAFSGPLTSLLPKTFSKLLGKPPMKHDMDDESGPLSALSGPLTSLLPKTLVKLLGKPPMKRGFTVKISSRKPKKLSPVRKLSSRSRTFPFFPFPFSNLFSDLPHELETPNAFTDDDDNEDEDLQRQRRNDDDDGDKKSERQKMVDVVTDEARASVHHAVDGIFDKILKKIEKMNRK